MRIHLELAGQVRRPFPESRRDIELVDGARVTELFEQLGYAPTETKYVLVQVNGEKAGPSRVLNHQDHVFVALMVGGG